MSEYLKNNIYGKAPSETPRNDFLRNMNEGVKKNAHNQYR